MVWALQKVASYSLELFSFDFTEMARALSPFLLSTEIPPVLQLLSVFKRCAPSKKYYLADHIIDHNKAMHGARDGSRLTSHWPGHMCSFHGTFEARRPVPDRYGLGPTARMLPRRRESSAAGLVQRPKPHKCDVSYTVSAS